MVKRLISKLKKALAADASGAPAEKTTRSAPQKRPDSSSSSAKGASKPRSANRGTQPRKAAAPKADATPEVWRPGQDSKKRPSKPRRKPDGERKPAETGAGPAQAEQKEKEAPAGERPPRREGDRRPRRDRPRSKPRSRPQADTRDDAKPAKQPRDGAQPPAKPEKPETPETPWTPDSFLVPEKEGETRFHDFELPDPVMHAVDDLKFQYCTPIQAQTLGDALKGRDILGKAQTGTGKTAAFLIAALAYMDRHPYTDTPPKGTPRVLIIAPTRELVIQICRDAEALGKYAKCHSMAIYGGMDYKKQQDEVKGHTIDIVAATPGRLLDFKRNRDIDLSQVEILVIDEADRMLDMGFIPDVRTIISAIPPKERRQTMFYSATLDDTVTRLASQWTRDPAHVDIAPEQVAVDTVEQTVMMMTARDKFSVMYNVLQKEKPTRALIFCNRRDTSQRLTEELERRDITCALLSGSVNQKVRLRTLDAFRAGEIPIVIATDVAGRGIHVDDIDLVVNYDIPYEPEDYVHRIGRTGRAGQSGRAYTFACEEEAFTLPEIEEYIGRSLNYAQVDEELLQRAPRPTRPAKPRPPDADRDRRGGGGRGRSGGRPGGSRGGPRGGGRSSGGRHSGPRRGPR